MKLCLFSLFAVGSVLGGLAGCGGAREVEVSGEVKTSATVQVQGPIRIDVFQVAEEKGQPDRKLRTVEIASPGPFSAKVEVDGKKLRLFALDDRNRNGSCDQGEAWSQSTADVGDDDKAEAVTLYLAPQTCPAPEASK